jgi:hypothetical protein
LIIETNVIDMIEVRNMRVRNMKRKPFRRRNVAIEARLSRISKSNTNLPVGPVPPGASAGRLRVNFRLTRCCRRIFTRSAGSFRSLERRVVNPKIVLRGLVTRARGAAKPSYSLPHILFDSAARLITQTKVALGRGDFLFRRQFIPLDRLFVILGHDLPGFVKDSQVKLGLGLALFRRRMIPFDRLRVVLGNTLAGFV